MSEELLTQSAEETIAWGREFAARVKAPVMILLSGDLGSGKTTLVKGLVQGLKIKPSQVNSPTFVLMNIYDGKVPIYHFDLYRLEAPKEIEGIGFEEFINDPKAVCCVEWADRAGLLLPPHTRWLRFEVVDETSRRIRF